MPDVLAQGASWLEDQRHQHLTTVVNYHRAGDAAALSATIGRTVFEQEDQAGGITRIESRDYLVRASDLILAGAVTLPKPGDLILESDGIATYTYEVMAPGDEPRWRYSDMNRATLRIHTKQVAVGAP